jgi:triacylglycerol esterase/lipase EstA (alpha/beta hydrolase family)
LNFLVEYIKNHPDEKIYITGHSLGGAISMMIAVRLVDAGADMKNIKVITFGAPAVGNKNFVEKYKDKINLTRCVMDSDIVDVSLDIFGYTHFGEVVNYKQVESSTQYAHAMSLYLDCALRKFYDAELKINSQNKIETPVYIAPITMVHKSFRPVDEKYIKTALVDGYTSRFAKITFNDPQFTEIKKSNDFSYNVKEYINAAKISGSKFIVIPIIHTKPVRDAKQHTIYVLVEEVIFDAKGHLMTMNTSGMTSKDVSILDAAFFGQESLRESRENTVK